MPLAERSGLSSETARLVGIWSPPRGGESANAWVYTANAGRDCLESDSDAAEEVARATRSLVRRAARFGVVRARAPTFETTRILNLFISVLGPITSNRVSDHDWRAVRPIVARTANLGSGDALQRRRDEFGEVACTDRGLVAT